jgi:hypothetical protein
VDDLGCDGRSRDDVTPPWLGLRHGPSARCGARDGTREGVSACPCAVPAGVMAGAAGLRPVRAPMP